ncbi:MAG: hypothetical protein FWC56_00035, partial [Phycisphaerae bacterium]|nr:hypothetical protein [Phycisphaerae bacterium]
QIINDRTVSIITDQPVSSITDRPDSIVSDRSNERPDERPAGIINNRPNNQPASTANLEVQWPGGVLLRVQGCEVRVIKAIVATISASSKRGGASC